MYAATNTNNQFKNNFVFKKSIRYADIKFNFFNSNFWNFFLSNETKGYLKKTIYLHFFLIIGTIAHLLIYHFKYLHPEFNILLPNPQKWQYIWLSSTISSIIGFIMVSYDLINLLNYFQYSNIIFGILPVLFTIIFNMNDLWNYVETKATKDLFYGFPIILIWYIVLAILIQVHLGCFYFTRILIKNWKIGKNNKLA